MALLAVALLTWAAMPLQAVDADPDAQDAAYRNPAADGLMVHRVVPGSQSESLGLQPTDIIISYAGHALATVDDLKALIAQALPPPLSIQVVRGTTKLTITVAPGRLGCELRPVRTGVDSTLRAKRTVPLPPATPFAMDLSALRKAPRESWYAFHLGDHDPQVGFEHLYLAIDHDGLRVAYDFAFDSHQFPIIADYESSVFALPQGAATVTAIPPLLSTVLDGQDIHDHGHGQSAMSPSGQLVWSSTEAVSQQGRWGTVAKTHPMPTVPLAAALQMHLGGFLAHQLGACVHYSRWEDDQPAEHAMKVMREDTIELPDQSHRHAWVVQQFSSSGPDLICWYGDDGMLLKTEFGAAYGGAWSIMTTHDQALAGLTPSIRVRTGADPLPPTPGHAPVTTTAGAAGSGF